MPRKRHRKRSESTIVAALMFNDSITGVYQLYPKKVASSPIGQTLPRISQPRSILVLGKHLYLFTKDDNFKESMKFQRMRLAEDEATWSSLPPMPTPRNNFACAAFNGKIYFVGGANEENQPTRTVECYCPDNDKWETLKQMLAPRQRSCLVACQDRLYCLGGMGPSRFPSNYVQMLDPKEKVLVWRSKKNLLCERVFFAAVVVEGNIYVLGKNVNLSENQRKKGGVPSSIPCSLATVEKYNPVEDEWTRFVMMKTPRDHFSACVWRGKIVIGGGAFNRPNLAKKHNVRFSEDMQKWYVVPRPNLQVETELLSENLPHMEMYDFEKGSWEVLATSYCSLIYCGAEDFFAVF